LADQTGLTSRLSASGGPTMAGQEHRKSNYQDASCASPVDRRHFEKLKALQGTSEAAQLPSLQCVLELNWRRFLRFAGSGRVLADIDTPADYERFLTTQSDASTCT